MKGQSKSNSLEEGGTLEDRVRSRLHLSLSPERQACPTQLAERVHLALGVGVDPGMKASRYPGHSPRGPVVREQPTHVVNFQDALLMTFARRGQEQATGRQTATKSYTKPSRTPRVRAMARSPDFPARPCCHYPHDKPGQRAGRAAARQRSVIRDS